MKNLEKIFEIKGKKFLLRVETSDAASDYPKYEELRNDIWRFPEDNLPGSRNMLSESYFHDGSALYVGAFVETGKGTFSFDRKHLVGFCYGWVGVKDKKKGYRSVDNLQFYSQYAGVKEKFRNYGLGMLLKEFQREVVLNLLGITTMTCTYDPLTGINAYRNIHYFGMEVAEYKEDIYGEFGGILNRPDIPSDRFFVTWDLLRKIKRAVTNPQPFLQPRHLAIITSRRKIRGKTGLLQVEIIENVRFDLKEKILLAEIPIDYYTMLRETDVPDKNVRRIPLHWRLETRRLFEELLRRKYRIADFWLVKGKPGRNFYVFQK